MYRPSITTAIRPMRQSLPISSARAYSKATLIGRLGAVPEARQTADGKPYVRFPLAVSGPIKKDGEGKPVLDSNGYPTRDTDWFSIFAFRANSGAYLEKLEPGSLLLVEATLRTTTKEEDGINKTSTVFNETNTRVLSLPKPKAA